MYKALGWRGTGESWEWGSDEHAAQRQTPVWAEKSTRGKEGKVTAGRLRCTDMPAQGAEGGTG